MLRWRATSVLFNHWLCLVVRVEDERASCQRIQLMYIIALFVPFPAALIVLYFETVIRTFRRAVLFDVPFYVSLLHDVRTAGGVRELQAPNCMHAVWQALSLDLSV